MQISFADLVVVRMVGRRLLLRLSRWLIGMQKPGRCVVLIIK